MDIICGMNITGNEVVIVIIKGDNKQDFQIINGNSKKVILGDEKNQSDIKSFYEVIEDFLKQNQVKKVLIKRPSTNGKYKAGHVAFKIEAILQMASIPTELLSSIKIASVKKKNNITIDKYNEICKYQHEALETAFCGLD